jgi:hypothetical protein
VAEQEFTIRSRSRVEGTLEGLVVFAVTTRSGRLLYVSANKQPGSEIDYTGTFRLEEEEEGSFRSAVLGVLRGHEFIPASDIVPGLKPA